MKEQKNHNKHLLLATAEAMFAENGYEGTTVRDIAAKAETNAALIYYHFESKEQLYRSIFDRKFRLLDESLRALQMNAEASSLEKLERYISVYVANIRDNFYFYRILNSELFSFRDYFFKGAILNNAKSIVSIFREVIGEGIAKKEFRNVDTDLFLMTLFHLLHQVIGRSPLASELLNLEEIAEEQIVDRIKSFVHHQLCLPHASLSHQH